jgi:hypothetical protein
VAAAAAPPASLPDAGGYEQRSSSGSYVMLLGLCLAGGVALVAGLTARQRTL